MHRDVLLSATLPYNNRSLTPLPRDRRKDFVERLTALATRAVGERADLAASGIRYGRRQPQLQSATPDPLIQTGCATCRGHCCWQGGTHAYLSEDTILDFLHDHPGACAEQVVAAYAAYLPGHSVDNSCVFHAAQGCALPRTLRSALCNRYECPELVHLASEIQSGAAVELVQVTVADQQQMIEVVAIDPAD